MSALARVIHLWWVVLLSSRAVGSTQRLANGARYGGGEGLVLLQTQVLKEGSQRTPNTLDWLETLGSATGWENVGHGLSLGLRRGGSTIGEAASSKVNSGRSIEKTTILLLIILIETIILVPTIVIPLLVWIIAATISRLVKAGIGTLDRSFLGADVEIEYLSTNVCRGVIIVKGFKLQNPLGGKYKSAYLLKAGQVHIDVDMLTLVFSCFRYVRIDKLEFKDVDVIYEKGWHSSNAQEVLSFLQGEKKEQQPAETAADAAASSAACSGGETTVILREVSVEDVGARLQAKALGGMGMRLSVGDIHFKNFTEEVGESKFGVVLQVLLKSVLKTVIVNVAGKRIGEHLL